jgi:DNA repair protein RadA/Sms
LPDADCAIALLIGSRPIGNSAIHIDNSAIQWAIRQFNRQFGNSIGNRQFNRQSPIQSTIGNSIDNRQSKSAIDNAKSRIRQSAIRESTVFSRQSAMKAKTIYACQECGAQSPKWIGRCADCGAWNSYVEERPVPAGAGAGAAAGAAAQRYSLAATSAPRLYEEIDTVVAERLSTGIGEFDRVLGGGVVPGSLVLIGGEPGIGKSTLLLQAAAHFAKTCGSVLYSSGEESEHQIKSRGQRLGVTSAPLYLLAETCLERILEEVARLRPAFVIVDSVQTVFSLKFQSAPGSVGQVREAATQLLFAAKGQNIPTFLVGHVTKDGSLAGPKVLEHIVDTVLYFEGEKHHSHRVVRAVKNRFGAISELGVFEMTGQGLRAVPNPSQLFLAERRAGAPGSAVLCCVEGSRPLLVEVQALVSTSSYGNARRMASGLDQNRLSLLLAVLEKRAGLNLIAEDVFVNVAGGLTIEEPAADLAVVAAVASSVRNRAIRAGTAMFGEVGLAGEVRGTAQAALRVREAAQLGFTRCIMPQANVVPEDAPSGFEQVGVQTVGEALDQMMEW